jgi:putative ABC transport system permease protein
VEATIVTMTAFYVLFGSIIAVGVVYNAARISLSERGRELASLRVLGFGKGEVASILLSELAVFTLIALPLGCLLGFAVAALMVDLFSSDLFRLPLVIERSTYGYACLVVVMAAVGTGIAVARRVAELDLIEVLKTRE